ELSRTNPETATRTGDELFFDFRITLRSFPESQLRCYLEKSGPTGPLRAEEVEGELIGEVLYFTREGQLERVTFYEVRQSEGVQELRGNSLFGIALTDTLPTDEKLVHVARVPSETQLVPDGCNAPNLKPCRAVSEQVGSVRYAIPLKVAEDAVARRIPQVDV